MSKIKSKSMPESNPVTYSSTITDKNAEKLATLRQQIPGLLSQFKHQFVLTHVHPEDESYQSSFEETKANLENINNEVQQIRANIRTAISTLDTSTLDISNKVDGLKQENTTMSYTVGDLANEDDSAKQRSKNIDTLSHYQKIYNREIIFGMLLVLLLMMRYSSSIVIMAASAGIFYWLFFGSTMFMGIWYFAT